MQLGHQHKTKLAGKNYKFQQMKKKKMKNIYKTKYFEQVYFKVIVIKKYH